MKGTSSRKAYLCDIIFDNGEVELNTPLLRPSNKSVYNIKLLKPLQSDSAISTTRALDDTQEEPVTAEPLQSVVVPVPTQSSPPQKELIRQEKRSLSLSTLRRPQKKRAKLDQVEDAVTGEEEQTEESLAKVLVQLHQHQQQRKQKRQQKHQRHRQEPGEIIREPFQVYDRNGEPQGYLHNHTVLLSVVERLIIPNPKRAREVCTAIAGYAVEALVLRNQRTKITTGRT